MKIILLLVTILASAFGARAQGLIFFGNNVNSTKISTNGYDGGPAQGLTTAAPNAFYYALFYSTNATTVHGSTSAVITDGSITDGYGNTSGIFVFDDPNWTLAAYGTNSSSSAGRFSSSAQNADGSTTVPGVPGGATANFVVLGWSAGLGSTIAALEHSLLYGPYAIWLGESAVSGPIQLGNGSIVPTPNLFGTGGAPQISGFIIGAVTIPEPSSLALAVTGLAGLFFFRRRASV